MATRKKRMGAPALTLVAIQQLHLDLQRVIALHAADQHDEARELFAIVKALTSSVTDSMMRIRWMVEPAHEEPPARKGVAKVIDLAAALRARAKGAK